MELYRPDIYNLPIPPRVPPLKRGINTSDEVYAIWNEKHPNDSMPQAGYVIHHIDGNHFNNSPNNLIKLTKAEHISLHNRGKKMREETKKKISKAKEGVPFDEEHKKALSMAHADFSGEKHPFWGKHHTEETRKRLSSNHKGVPWSTARREAYLRQKEEKGNGALPVEEDTDV